MKCRNRISLEIMNPGFVDWRLKLEEFPKSNYKTFKYDNINFNHNSTY